MCGRLAPYVSRKRPAGREKNDSAKLPSVKIRFSWLIWALQPRLESPCAWPTAASPSAPAEACPSATFPGRSTGACVELLCVLLLHSALNCPSSSRIRWNGAHLQEIAQLHQAIRTQQSHGSLTRLHMYSRCVVVAAVALVKGRGRQTPR